VTTPVRRNIRMPHLSFHLLGTPLLEQDGEPLRIVRRRALATAVYLAKTGQRHNREQLMAIFWPDHAAADARADLRRTLHVLRRAFGGDRLESHAGFVQWVAGEDCWLDVDEFHQLQVACTQHDHPPDAICDRCLPLLARAANLYRDEFLAGFSLPDSPPFDAWQFFERERLRAEAADVLSRLIHGYTEQHDYVAAIGYAHRRLVLDPLDEESHRCLMELYAASGQAAAAYRQYNQCLHLLQNELNLTPSPETDDLLRTIRERAEPTQRTVDDLKPEHLVTQSEDAIEHLPAKDEIRLVTVASIGLLERAYNVVDPALDEMLADMQSLTAIVDELASRFDGQCQSSVSEDLLLFFGVDHVREDDAERGVRAALAVTRVADEQGLAVQAGVNSGMAYIRRPAVGETAEFQVMGPVINLATRLRNRAEPGQVLVGAGTYRPTRGAFQYDTLAMALPGIQGTVPAYQLQRPYTHPTKTRGIEGLHAEMIGRHGDLNTLRTLLSDVATGRRGRLVSIVADAGVGKSRLVAEARQLAEANVFRWLEGRSQSLTASTGYGLFTDMLSDYLSRQAAHSSTADALLGLLLRFQQAGQLSDEEVEEMGPLLGRLLCLRFESDWDTRLNEVTAEHLRRRTLQVLRRLCRLLAIEQPLALVCEDLHWADPLSLDVIGALMETLADVPILLLAVYRPDEAQADGQLIALARRRCPDLFTVVELRALDEEESRQLVASLLAIDALPSSMRSLITDKAQGNPLYLEEVVRTLIDGDVLYRDGDRWRARRLLASVTVPATLQSIILSRIDRLAPVKKTYLQAAAVLGRLFRPRLVDAIAGSAAAHDTTLAGLVQDALVFQERAVPEPEYSFHHVLVRDAIYQDLPRGDRIRLHRQAGQAIEALYARHLQPQIELVAHHYDLGDDAEKAIHYLLLAGRKAQANYLNQEACASFERALARLDALEPTALHQRQRLDALERLGELQTMLEDFAEAETLLHQAVALATDLALPPRQRVQPILSLCQLYNSTGDIMAQLEQCERGLALIDDLDAPMEFVVLKTYQSTAFSGRDDWRSAISSVGEIVDILPDLPYSGHLIDVWFSAVLWCRLTKHVAWGFDLIDSVLDEALRRRDHWTVAQLHLHSRVFLYETVGDSTSVLSSILAAERFAEKIGDKTLMRGYRYWLSIYHGWLCGNLDEAERYARLALADRSDLYSPSSHVFAHSVLGLVYFCRHDWQQALDRLEHAHSLAVSDEVLVDGVRRGIVGLAWTYTALERKAEGLALLAKIAQEEELHIESWPTVACALAGLEPMCEDTATYDALCQEIVAARLEEPLPLDQWRLLPAEPNKPGRIEEAGLSGWTWHDPFGDCSYEAENGSLIIHAANYHDLWLNNFAAPRLMRPVEGNFAVQTICTAAYDDQPPLGGILLWLDRENYLRLTWNTHAPDGINLLGCTDNIDGFYGMGRLPSAERVHLRLERIGSRVRGLCSTDGLTWHSVGEVGFPAVNRTQAGPLAIGMIHRYVHAGAWPAGSAIRFDGFRVGTI
jgi:DNA-binding SARP family transcriptional activator/class 3 adenylate cyclase/regulation of enolase protein 1 (concanavalin A-like superfamily)